MALIIKYYKHSNEGYLAKHMYSEEIKGMEIYFKNGVESDESIMKGCVPLSEKKYRRQIKHLKNNKQDGNI